MTLLVRLSRLERDGLIQMARALPELEYIFRQGLIKDAAYFSLLKGDRRALHRALGEALAQAAASQRAYLAAHIDDPAQRAAFLARADQLALTH